MKPEEWLRDFVPGFIDLTEEERQAIINFSLLWSYFEAKALSTKGSAKTIRKVVKILDEQSRLNVSEFTESLRYFRTRYFPEGEESDHFSGANGLNFRSNDDQALVEGVLKGEITKSADIISALLIVVYRLRNNLFHGSKWAYNIRGQLDNFNHASSILMKALETCDA